VQVHSDVVGVEHLGPWDVVGVHYPVVANEDQDHLLAPPTMDSSPNRAWCYLLMPLLWLIFTLRDVEWCYQLVHDIDVALDSLPLVLDDGLGAPHPLLLMSWDSSFDIQRGNFFTRPSSLCVMWLIVSNDVTWTSATCLMDIWRST
jgi:hypothetical protein